MSDAGNRDVADWATDFDHADPAYNRDAHRIWDDLRGRCPIAHTQRYGGAWLPVTHAAVSEIAYDTEHFSSRGIIVKPSRPKSPAPAGNAPPITSDPPFHREARRLLLPAFAPKRIEPWRDDVRAFCRTLLDGMEPLTPGSSVIDAAAQYAHHVPVHVMARMLGFPPKDDALFREFIHLVLEGVTLDPAERRERAIPVYAYLEAHIADHRLHPRDDLTSFLLDAAIFGEPLDDEHVSGAISLLLLAGIDTTWSAIGSSLWHLASYPDDLRRLRAEPELMPTAIEELLRAYAPVTMARLVTQDHEFHGCPMKTDDWVLLPFPAANRDPAMFEDPNDVVLDRAENRHAAFGLGMHRCLGSNLARLELRVAIEEFIARFAAFELADPAAVTWSVGQIRGPRALPIRILARA